MLLNYKSRFLQLRSYFRGSTIISIDYDDTVRDKFTAESCEHSSDSVMEQEPEQQVRNGPEVSPHGLNHLMWRSDFK